VGELAVKEVGIVVRRRGRKKGTVRGQAKRSTYRKVPEIYWVDHRSLLNDNVARVHL